MRILLTTAVAALALAGCKDSYREAKNNAEMAAEARASQAADLTPDTAALDAVLAAQPDDIKARYDARHPGQTLEFFGVAPGMTVVDVLPGSEGEGWYTGILASYLGANGAKGELIGVDYDLAMWPEFGGFADAEFIEARQTWASDWVAGANGRETAGDFGDVDIDFNATTFSNADRFAGEADMVLFMRAMHNLARFESVGGFLTQAIDDSYTLLKPGGHVGVVQHRAPADADEDWANGSNGYVKQQAIIDAFESAGFELVATSEINANPKDQPTSDDAVWRLPPTLGTSREDAELKAKMEAIGESDRMTLLFRKPA